MEHNWETNKEMKNEEKTWEGCIHWTLVNYTPNQKWDKDIKRKVKQNQTWKVTVDSDSFLKKPVLAFGTDAWITQVSDLHIFRLSESPTNIIFLPLHLFRHKHTILSCPPLNWAHVHVRSPSPRSSQHRVPIKPSKLSQSQINLIPFDMKLPWKKK